MKGRLLLSGAARALGLAVLTAGLLSGCGGGGGSAPSGTQAYSVSGNLTGLTSGASIVLSVDGQNQTLNQNGGYTTSLSLSTGSSYSIAIAKQPAGETCSVTNGSGTIGSSNANNIQIACTPNPAQTYTIGGEVTGLSGSVVLQDNGGDTITVTPSGFTATPAIALRAITPVAFTFPTALVNLAAYNVTVLSQPTGQTCTVANAAGTVQGANVTNVAVSCTNNPPPTYTIGGTLTGLPSGGLVTLQDNGGDNLNLSANGSFSFATPVGSTYNVTVFDGTATCSVSNGSGTATANVTNVQVTCAPSSYSIGGTLSGLAAGSSVVLQDNGGNNLTLTNNGSFTFASNVTSGNPYAVTVGTQPTGQTCTVSNGSGAGVTANVTNIGVACISNETVLYSFGGQPDGANPRASLVMDASGNLYGTTPSGGANGNGTVFKITPTGGETILYSFGTAPDGSAPTAGLLMDASGNLYGTTFNGGANGSGAVFKITPAGAETVLHSFGAQPDGANPDASLVMDASGNLYGTTQYGGANGNGTVFKITP